MSPLSGRRGALSAGGRDGLIIGVAGAAALIAGVTLVARVTGFGRTLAFSHNVGGTCIGQAYTTANLVPNVLYEIAAGGALAGVVVPLLAGAVRRAQGQEVQQVTSALLTWTILVLAPLSALLWVLADPLAQVLLLSGETCPGQQALAASMLAVFAPQVLLYGVGAVLTGFLQAHQRFAWPAASPLMSSLVVILAYLEYGRTGSLWWLSGGTTAGVAMMAVPLVIPVMRSGTRLRPTLRFPGDAAVQARRLAGAGIAGLLAQQVFVLTTLTLANRRGGPDAITVFTYSQAVYLLPYALLAVPLATATFPRLAADTGAEFAALASRSTRVVLGAGLLGAALLAATAPAVAEFFAALDRGTVTLMAPALLALAPGLVGYAVLAQVSRALYALHQGRAAAVAAAAGWLVAALAAVLIVLLLGDPRATVVGICAASSIGMTLTGVLSIAALRRAAGPEATAGLGRTAGAGVLLAVVAATCGHGLARLLLDRWGTTSIAAVGAGAAAAAVVLAIAALGRWWPGIAVGRGPRSATAATTRAEVTLVLGTSDGGTGRHVRTLALGLARPDGAQVTVAGPASAQLRFDLVGAGATFVELPIGERPHLLRDGRTLWRLRRLCRGSDVVHAHGLRAGALAVVAARLGSRFAGRGVRATPVVVTVHNALVGSGAVLVVHRALEWIVARGACTVLVVSGDLGRRFVALGARDVQPALVPAPRLAVVEPGPAKLRLRAELGLEPERRLLVTVARLAPQKGLDLLLTAVGQLDAVHQVLVVVAGAGPLHEALQHRIERERLPVRLLGHRSDVAELLAAADLVVVPSVWEGQPLIVQEALQAGAVVVATEVGGTAQVGGDAVKLVPGADPAALAQLLSRTLTELDNPGVVADLRAAALRRAALLPTDDDALAQVRALYAQLINLDRASPH